MTSAQRGDLQEESIKISISGRSLVDNPLLNKGSAFSEEERRTERIEDQSILEWR